MEKFDKINKLVENKEIRLIQCKTKLRGEISKSIENWDIIHKLGEEGYRIYTDMKMLEDEKIKILNNEK